MPSPTLSRRQLARRAAVASMWAAVDPATPQDRGGQPPLPAQDQAEVDGKFDHMVRKYGDRLNDEQKTRARTVLSRHHRMLMRVREFPLENSDPPATVLRLVPRNLEE